MATFDYTVDYGSKMRKKPNVSVAKFGDGYEQREANGINNRKETWDVIFANRSTEEADEIEEFLDDHGAETAFDWTSPRATVGKFFCREWDYGPSIGVYKTINATFEQVIEA